MTSNLLRNNYSCFCSKAYRGGGRQRNWPLDGATDFLLKSKSDTTSVKKCRFLHTVTLNLQNMLKRNTAHSSKVLNKTSGRAIKKLKVYIFKCLI